MSPSVAIPAYAIDPVVALLLAPDALLEQARSAKLAKRRRDYLTACEAWLRAEHGVELGESIRVHYAEETREVLIENFELHWPIGRDLDQPTLVFEGPTLFQKPRRVEKASNWCTRATRLTLPKKPSSLLRAGLDKMSAMMGAYSKLVGAYSHS